MWANVGKKGVLPNYTGSTPFFLLMYVAIYLFLPRAFFSIFEKIFNHILWCVWIYLCAC